MQTGIEVIAQSAFKVGAGMIGVSLSAPVVHREVVPTLEDAIALKDRLLSEYDGISVYGNVRNTRSPRGYKGNENLVRGDNVL